MRYFATIIIFIAFLLVSVVSAVAQASAGMIRKVEMNDLPDKLGITHVAGKYHLTDKDFMSEGADQILDLGSRVIKVWFESNPAGSYPYNCQWPKINSLVELAKTKYFAELFDKPFKTYVLMCFSVGRGAAYFRSGMTEEQKADEQRQLYELAKYLLTRYKGTGKTFVLQHWEGDWLIRGNYDAKADPTPKAIEGMIDWLNARQRGVNQAREEVGADDVRIYCAAEVNRVVDSMKEGRANLVNKVLPHTHMDLISYSAWDAATAHYSDPNVLRDALDFIATNAPDSADFGAKNVYLGEFGMPENDFMKEQVGQAVHNAVKTSLDWGCPYIIYWQMYCNEIKDKQAPVPVKSNDAVRGFWLIKPDGSKSETWHYFYDLLNPSKQIGGLSHNSTQSIAMGMN